MPPRERDALLLYALADLSYDEIAVHSMSRSGPWARGFTGRV